MGGSRIPSWLSTQLAPLTRTWLPLNRFWKRITYLTVAASLGLLMGTMIFWDTINEIPDRWHFPFLNPEPVSTLRTPTQIFEHEPDGVSPDHPIHDLLKDAGYEHQRLLMKRTKGVASAAQAYRARRGRHPPPWFDKWVSFAEAHDCIIIEEFFDRIYHDLDPFWALSPNDIRANAASAPAHLQVRNGKAFRSTKKQPFIENYYSIVQRLEKFLPDLDVPINHMDEPRVLVPWDVIANHMAASKISLQKQNLELTPPMTTFTLSLPTMVEPSALHFNTSAPYWSLAQRTCAPDTGSQDLEIDGDFSTPPQFPQTYPFGSHFGYVRNWTTSQDVCRHPHLRNMHGTFVEPISISTSTSLIPMFSGSKLLMNNDILLPAAVYWGEEERFAASKKHVPWSRKRDEVFWRGTASGGRNRAENWTRFQRHRFVSMLNGTQIVMTTQANSDTRQQQDGLPHNFPLPNDKLYPLVSTKLHLLPDWIRSLANVAFYWLECFPSTRDYRCSYTGPWYRRGRPVTMQRMYYNKYLPDVDGNSFSGRFRAFLKSNSLPLKATIYTEWHDSRLIPWKHFVPMDNTFMDLYAILEFLFSRDDLAEQIAMEGREWADRVLRKDDILVYVYRLLLEYARVSDPNRDDIGFGQDLADID